MSYDNDLGHTHATKNEAIAAADEALSHLYAAQDQLNSARNWGFYDILGGGAFGSIIKHSKMQKANQEIQQAKEAVARFARTLEGVEGFDTSTGLNVNVDGMWSFVDIFMDNVFADIMVQQRINEAQNQVAQAIGQVEYLRNQLSR